jgi:gamma-glutamyltranspeptidase/glutathione hydrolase/leukotriene-C4 hydrolase
MKLLDQFDNINLDDLDLSYHRFTESCKFAFAQRSKLGDWQMPEISESVKKVVDYIQGDDWINWVKPKFKDNSTQSNTEYYGAEYQYVTDDDGTSHIAILSPNGDAVSATSTVNTYFGSGNY